jgi:hypothetical protein
MQCILHQAPLAAKALRKKKKDILGTPVKLLISERLDL